MITVVVQVLPISARVLAISQTLTYQFASVPAANLSRYSINSSVYATIWTMAKMFPPDGSCNPGEK